MNTHTHTSILLLIIKYAILYNSFETFNPTLGPQCLTPTPTGLDGMPPPPPDGAPPPDDEGGGGPPPPPPPDEDEAPPPPPPPEEEEVKKIEPRMGRLKIVLLESRDIGMFQHSEKCRDLSVLDNNLHLY